MSAEDLPEFIPRPFQSSLMLFFTKANDIGLKPVMIESVVGLDDCIHSLQLFPPIPLISG